MPVSPELIPVRRRARNRVRFASAKGGQMMTISKEQQQSEAPERGAGPTTVDLVESLARLRQEPAWLTR